jgi:putative chitinase
MSIVDGDILKDIAPRVTGAKAANQARILSALDEVIGATLDKYAIDSRLRDAHFLAQACEESDGFCTTEEYASGAAYEGRLDLGNTQKGDGRLFKGRGLFQLTGRSNYESYGKALGLDLINNPALAAEPVNSLLIACEYWRRNNLDPLADNDDLIGITKKINGGLNGIDARRAYLATAKAALARVQAIATPTPDPAATPVLRRGSKGEAVADLQTRLKVAGYPLAIDGDFGPATELAVVHFQTDQKLTADGIVGPQTWAALPSAPAPPAPAA